MARIDVRFIVILIVLVGGANAAETNKEHKVCLDVCAAVCLIQRNPFCLIKCLATCHIPKDVHSKCTFDCAKSTCTKFVNGT